MPSPCARGRGSCGCSSTSCGRPLRPPCSTSGADELSFGEGDGCRTLNFFEARYPWPERITALGLQDGEGFRARYPGIRYVQGDACALPFGDGEFDVVFSNAVIEHVGGARAPTPLRARGASCRAKRVRRRRPTVASRSRCTRVFRSSTGCPTRCLTRFIARPGRGSRRSVHLLTRGSLAALFPGRVRIVNLGLTLVAIVD